MTDAQFQPFAVREWPLRSMHIKQRIGGHITMLFGKRRTVRVHINDLTLDGISVGRCTWPSGQGALIGIARFDKGSEVATHRCRYRSIFIGPCVTWVRVKRSQRILDFRAMKRTPG